MIDSVEYVCLAVVSFQGCLLLSYPWGWFYPGFRVCFLVFPLTQQRNLSLQNLMWKQWEKNFLPLRRLICICQHHTIIDVIVSICEDQKLVLKVLHIVLKPRLSALHQSQTPIRSFRTNVMHLQRIDSSSLLWLVLTSHLVPSARDNKIGNLYLTDKSDQKRPAAVQERGIHFFTSSGCFPSSVLQHFAHANWSRNCQ